MKRFWALVLITAMLALALSGCGEYERETVPKEENLPQLTPMNGNKLESEHQIDDMKFIAIYDTGDYDLSRWRVTDSKVINMSAKITNVPEGAVILIEHVHIDVSLKSTNPQLDGLSQDYMDDSYHGTSQDGFWVNENYQYENKFAIEGFSKDLIEGWSFVCGDYGSGYITQHRLTEKNLIEYGNVYANKIQVVYDVLIKYADEDCYHVVSILDEFLIPVTYQAETTK